MRGGLLMSWAGPRDILRQTLGIEVRFATADP
jgi:hypothetical protein